MPGEQGYCSFIIDDYFQWKNKKFNWFTYLGWLSLTAFLAIIFFMFTQGALYELFVLLIAANFATVLSVVIAFITIAAFIYYFSKFLVNLFNVNKVAEEEKDNKNVLFGIQLEYLFTIFIIGMALFKYFDHIKLLFLLDPSFIIFLGGAGVLFIGGYILFHFFIQNKLLQQNNTVPPSGNKLNLWSIGAFSLIYAFITSVIVHSLNTFLKDLEEGKISTFLDFFTLGECALLFSLQVGSSFLMIFALLSLSGTDYSSWFKKSLSLLSAAHIIGNVTIRNTLAFSFACDPVIFSILAALTVIITLASVYRVYKDCTKEPPLLPRRVLVPA